MPTGARLRPFADFSGRLYGIITPQHGTIAAYKSPAIRAGIHECLACRDRCAAETRAAYRIGGAFCDSIAITELTLGGAEARAFTIFPGTAALESRTVADIRAGIRCTAARVTSIRAARAHPASAAAGPSA